MKGPGATRRIAMMVLWPAFLVEVLAVGLVFSLVDPDALLAGHAGVSPMAVYSLGFLFFWVMGALASMLTCYLAMVPDNEHPPF